jgi:hypothetical protein
MPSFYPRQNMPRQLLTPPEFVPSYHSACGNMEYQQQSAYQGQPAIRQQDDGYEFADRYGQLAIAMPPMYPQAGTYLSSAPPSLPPPSSFYEPTGPTVLPPMRMPPGQSMADVALQHQRAHEYSQRTQAPAKEEKPVGGVSAKLDYDMDVMTDFVCDTALSLITPGRMAPSSFRKWVHQVLCATRLPSATILLSMFYLATRMPMLDQPKTDSHLFRLLTIALVLGSKFLDDNTFINRSWSEVSGIRVEELNELEMAWLTAIKFQLHRDPTEQHGWKYWSEQWTEFQDNAAIRAGRLHKLSPIDTSMHRRSLNPNKPLPPLPMQQAYTPPYEFTPKSAQPSQTSFNLPPYSQYDPWRSASEQSPASAPTTGPTTPEYYGTAGAWAQPEGYSRRTMFGFPPQSHPARQTQPHVPTNYGQPAYTNQYNTSVWNQHNMNCSCGYCAQRHQPYFMAPGYGPQAVAV